MNCFTTYETKCDYGDIITIPNCPYPHDGLVVYVGLLTKKMVPDVEDFRKAIYNMPWPGSIEDFAWDIIASIKNCLEPKGAIVVIKSSLFDTTHAVAVDEVRQDWDVKMEMLRYMGL